MDTIDLLRKQLQKEAIIQLQQLDQITELMAENKKLQEQLNFIVDMNGVEILEDMRTDINQTKDDIRRG